MRLNGRTLRPLHFQFEEISGTLFRSCPSGIAAKRTGSAPPERRVKSMAEDNEDD
jgi:hypothetical protein